jgi:O-antigen/teichoic acid export membrane protein
MSLRSVAQKTRPGSLGGTFAASIAIQVTLVVTGIVVARALGPEDRGHFAMLTLVWAVAAQLGGLGIPYAVTYFIARAPQRAKVVVDAVWRPLMLQLFVASIATGVVLVLMTIDRPGYVRVGAAITVLAVVPAAVQGFALSTLQGLRRFTVFNVYRLLPNALFALLAATLWLGGADGFVLFVLGWAISRSVWAPFALRIARRRASEVDGEGPGSVSVEDIRRFGRRSIFGATPPLETYRLDQAVVALFLPAAALGFYVVSLAFTTLPRFLAQSVGLVASPTVSSRPSHAEAMTSMWRFSLLAAPFYLGAILVLWIGTPWLTEFFFGDEFVESADLTRILLIATALYCARRVLTDAARGAGFPGIGSVAELVAFFAAIPLLAAFVPLWDEKGVGYALIGASTIAFAVLFITLLRQRGRPAPETWEEDQLSADPVIP